MTEKINEYLKKKMEHARREKAIDLDMITLIKMIEIYRSTIQWISTVNACDYEYVKVARAAEEKAEELLK